MADSYLVGASCGHCHRTANVRLSGQAGPWGPWGESWVCECGHPNMLSRTHNLPHPAPDMGERVTQGTPLAGV